MPSDDWATQAANEIGEALRITSTAKLTMLAEDLRIEKGLVPWLDTRGVAESPSATIKRLTSLRNACRRLLTAIGHDSGYLSSKEIPPDEHWLHHLMWFVASQSNPREPERYIQNGDAQRDFSAWVESIERLQLTFDRAIHQAEMSKRPGRGGSRKVGDRTRRDTVVGLMGSYERFTCRKVGMRLDSITNKPTGPFLTFMEIALKALGRDDITKDAIRQILRDIQRDKLKTPN